MAKGGVSQNPPVIEKIGRIPLSGEAGPLPPPSPREARRQNFRVFYESKEMSI